MTKKQKIDTHQIGIVIVAAGNGERCGLDVPKQYAALGGIPVLMHTLGHLRRALPNAHYVLVIGADHQPFLDVCDVGDAIIVRGGDTRQASVQAGLEALQDANISHVLIHDAARPFVSAHVCNRLLAALETERAAVPGIPVADTLKSVETAPLLTSPRKQGEEYKVSGTINRAGLYRIQTPQAFDYPTILDAHRRAQHEQWETVTDDAGLCERLDIPVAMVEGDEHLFKITTKDDMERAQHMISNMHETRTGFGYDVHRLLPHDAPNQTIRLGGIDIPHTHYLKGHSDADVVLHALTDALLGALGEGDIGEHFPPSDDSFKNMDSARFVRHACDLMKERDACLTNADITIIGERPKISPHKQAMRERIADILGVDIARINIKATTTEGLGFEGRQEGIAVHAIVIMTLP